MLRAGLCSFVGCPENIKNNRSRAILRCFAWWLKSRLLPLFVFAQASTEESPLHTTIVDTTSMNDTTTARSGGKSRRRKRGFSGSKSRRHYAFSKQRRMAVAQQSVLQRITTFISNLLSGSKSSATTGQKSSAKASQPNETSPTRKPIAEAAAYQPVRTPRPPVCLEVTSPRLYVGNLSYDATESDLFALFNCVGKVQNAEVVSHKNSHRSKGFAFVQMQSIDDAKRAVAELHDREFMGRKLLVSGARPEGYAQKEG